MITNRATATWGDGSTGVDIAIQGAQFDYPSVSWRGVGDSDNTWVAANCTGTCTIPFDMAATISTATDYAKALLVADSAQRVLEMYHDQMDNGTIELEYPRSPATCPGNSACAVSRTHVAIPLALWNDGWLIGHEMGHVLQMQLFEQDFLSIDYSGSGDGWTFTSVENQSAATTDGWASYVGAVAWWNPASTLANPVISGFNLEAAALTFPTSPATNAWVVLQVAKSFWDLDDANNEAGVVDCDGAGGGIDDDVSNLGTTAISGAWDPFPNGTANRQDSESDPQGVNARDYDGNFNVNDETFLGHNAICSQDPN